MQLISALTPGWIAFEVLQLVVCERYLGLKQIKAGVDPRGLGPGELVAFFWCAAIFGYGLWMAAMLYFQLGMLQVVALSGVTLAGFSLRRICGLKWVLMVLTFEGAIRVGMLISLSLLLWKGEV